MTGDQFAILRKATGLGVVEFGRALGYEGNDNSVSVHVRGMERGARPIQPAIARLAAMLGLHGVPSPWVNCKLEGHERDWRRESPEIWAVVENVGGY